MTAEQRKELHTMYIHIEDRKREQFFQTLCDWIDSLQESAVAEEREACLAWEGGYAFVPCHCDMIDPDWTEDMPHYRYCPRAIAAAIRARGK